MTATATPLLATDEPAAVEIVNADGNGSAVLVCDHATNRVPQRLGGLGLDTTQLAAHIAWDAGAADVARRLSAQLDAPLLLSGYSRLVIDCNRPLASDESIPEQSAGVPVPGNRKLAPGDRGRRIDALYRPYHDAIARLLDTRAARPTLLLSLHSFAAVFHGTPRPWHAGVAYWRHGDLAALLRAALARDEDLTIGDNQPYAIEAGIDYTVPRHGEGRGLPSVMIEMREDEVRTSSGAAAWAARLAAAYRRIEPAALRLWQPEPGSDPSSR